VSSNRFLLGGARACAALWILAALCESPARAETGDLVMAEALFRDGKQLLAQKDYAKACPKLAESFRRDPATGTLLALAMCHERDGKLASAWGEYADVAARSKAESRSDREKAARAKVSELEGRVSRLTIKTSAQPGDAGSLEIKRNGSLVEAAAWGTALPIDGGLQVIEATSRGKKSWRTQVSVAVSGESLTVSVPPLDDLREATAAPVPAPRKAPPEPARAAADPPKAIEPEAVEKAPVLPPPAPEPVMDSASGLTGIQRWGIVSGVAGVVGLGVGGYFAHRAVSKNSDSQDACFGDLCTAAGKEDRLDARSAGDVATIALAAGGALTVSGIAMYVLGHRTRSSSSAFIQAVPLVDVSGGGAALQGQF
jgi:hypothetical protein